MSAGVPRRVEVEVQTLPLWVCLPPLLLCGREGLWSGCRPTLHSVGGQARTEPLPRGRTEHQRELGRVQATGTARPGGETGLVNQFPLKGHLLSTDEPWALPCGLGSG